MATISVTAPVTDERIVQDGPARLDIASKVSYLERDDREFESYVTIVQSFVADSSGERYVVGTIGQFVDRTFALRFMDENPDMFEHPASEWTLAYVERERVARTTVTIL